MALEPTGRLRETFRALRNPGFRSFWMASFVSNVGMYAQDIAQGWVVLEMTGSAEWLGLAAAARTLPSLLLSPLGGVYADRWNRRLTLGVYQAVMAMSAAVLAVLVYLDAAEPWHFVVAAMVTGAGNALSQPTNSSLVKDLLPAGDLVSGVTLYVQQVQIARTVGPLLASAVFWIASVEYGFHFNALSYIPLLIFCFVGRTRPDRGAAPVRRGIFRSLLDGAVYARSSRQVWVLLQVAALASLALFTLPTLLPVVSREIGSGPHLLAYLNGVAGLAAVVGATLVPSLLHRYHWVALLRVSLALSAAGLFGLVLSRGAAMAFAMSALQSGAGIMVWVIVTALLQRSVSDEYRGRVLSLNTLALGAGMLVGNLGAGVLAERIG
ncbi:MAG TPA: MFS transporter, partial [Kofleriaceae bacterium]|nr:MFS transporter [Kofleriaceae bacterium]